MAQKLKNLPVFTEQANGEVEDPRFISGHLGQSLCICELLPREKRKDMLDKLQSVSSLMLL